MARVRYLRDMVPKYTTKYSGDNVTQTFTAVKQIMETRFEEGAGAIYNAVELARKILTEEGVPTGQWGPYIAFAEILQKEAFSHSGLVLQKIASGWKAYFVTAHNCDPAVLDRIAKEIIGVAPPY